MRGYFHYLNSVGEDREKWQATALEPKFWIFEWHLLLAFAPIIFFMFNLYAWLTAFSILILCQILRIRGLTLPMLFRSIHFRLVGKRARAVYGYEKRKYH